MRIELLWVVLLAPFAAAGTIWVIGLARPRASAAVSIGAVAVSFFITGGFFVETLSSGSAEVARSLSVPWVSIPPLEIGFGLVCDSLSILMALVVTGVGGVIHIYSLAYMKGDRSFSRYFGCLSLFTGSMLGIVFSMNFIQIFMFWELVGLSSYLLIGFWYERPAAAEAGKKAFIVNRLGDFGLLLGILILYFHSGASTFDFSGLESHLVEHPMNGGLATLAGLLILCGAIGKSAQFPLHVWLPDAMEGPTPVSALIHAATMVAAGIYLVARVSFVFAASPAVLWTMAALGGGTAFLAATMAIVQTDLKKILAYSTISQLGFMMLALGVEGTPAATFHLTTHAFFKALLFLCAGSVIHKLHTQDIFEMGGLLKSMRTTSITFLIGAGALVGFPFSSGFFSKDEILAATREASLPLYILAAATAFLTAVYVGRVAVVAFLGEPRGRRADSDSPAVMTIPLIVLALFALGLGGISFMGGFSGFIHGHAGDHTGSFHGNVALLSTGLMSLGLLLSWFLYRSGPERAEALASNLRPIHTLLLRKYYVDEAYLWIVRHGNDGLARLSLAFDRSLLIGTLVNGTGATVRGLGRVAREFQTGRVRTYGTYFLLGLAAVIYLFLREN
ncbi:MAG: NADH-quinone oxidoreductase subunit L [Planctomycetota bacterium]|nr:NADH-quinone oxidoreductase subunit L [Planctomycetota bacterium]